MSFPINGTFKAAGGCHGSLLKEPIFVTAKGAHDNSVSDIFKNYPITGTNDDASGISSLHDEDHLMEVDDAMWVTPPGSGLDGIAGVNKDVTKTTG